MNEENHMGWKLVRGVRQDVVNLFKLFARADSVRFEDFCNVWKEMNFSLIFSNRISFIELLEFTEEILQIVKEYLSSVYEFSTRVSALYTLYGLYFKQPIRGAAKIRFTKSEWEEVYNLVENSKAAKHYDTVFIFFKLYLSGAYTFTATIRPAGLERGFKKYSEKKSSLISKIIDVELLYRPLISEKLVTSLVKLESLYCKKKSELLGSKNLVFINGKFAESLQEELKYYASGAQSQQNIKSLVHVNETAVSSSSKVQSNINNKGKTKSRKTPNSAENKEYNEEISKNWNKFSKKYLELTAKKKAEYYIQQLQKESGQNESSGKKPKLMELNEFDSSEYSEVMVVTNVDGIESDNGDNSNMLSNLLVSPSRKGAVKVQIQSNQQKSLTHLPHRDPVDIAFTDLQYTVTEGRKKNPKVILKNVSGRLRSGELTAIMGPSGAGKSTLLNILTGYKISGMKGSITINGQERNLNTYKKLSCYIMQDNQLHANLTVEEAMSVATNLKLEKSISKGDKEDMISEILETLGLQEHRKTMTSNLSGGQKKRLSIALELVNNPPIMFFDEPTSGLDSSSCFQCISLLKSLSRGGRTIICTIHQPSARLFEMFDHLYTLAEGQCVYQGSTKNLVPFLSTLNLNCPSYHNPASFIIEVSCGEYGDNVKKLVAAIDNGKNDIREGRPFPNIENLPPKVLNGLANVTNDIAKGSCVESDAVAIPVDLTSEKNENANATLLYPNATKVSNNRRYATSEFHQFWVVLKRTLLFSRRDWTLMYLRLFAHILVGFLIGALYYDIGNDGAKVLSNLGFLFFNMLFLMYTSMTITILSFPLEMPVLIKENFNRWYSLRAYYLAITVSDIPFQAVFCVIYVTIVYFLTSQPPELSRFLMFLAACLLISFDAQSVGLVVGAAMNVQNGVFLAPVMSVPFLLFSGFFVSFDAIPIYLRWITYLSYIRYGFEGTALATYSFDRKKLHCSQVYCHFKDPKTTLEELDMLNADFTIDIIALVVIFFVLRISAYLFLRWKLKSTR